MQPQIVRESDGAVADQLRAALMAWNESQAGPRNTGHVTLSIRDERGELLGGLVAEMFWNAAYVSVLWVDEAHRGNGYGTAFMQRAEESTEHVRVTLCSVDDDLPGTPVL